ncbi:Alanyl-tRNA synthetase [hydrothermal vent metagenome]|uniref:Alanine--tRNA ligase n=1 Tax=hydrothermal vent metagenome TaxID=652676 RepID=A0A1W1EI63_9ZZZZ
MDIRKEFLEYFKDKGHSVITSMPLVPDDPSLMFTNAGMIQFKDIFTGAVPIPANPTATSCQLCLRAGGKHNDLENVGYTARHHTLFEMLGNFSFGDYFKEDAISYAWEFITKNLELPIEKLWVTIHNDDDEAYEIWSRYISQDRIIRFGDKDNFWSMGDTGACGPCSEIFYDQGEENFNSPEDKMGGEGDRFLEIWNLVFMQYERAKDGTLTPLPKPSIDTGMGLERIIAIKEGVLNNFDSSQFKPIVNKIEELSPSTINDKNIGSFRVIADHIRAVSFMLSDGILFDKEGRGYVLRRILRRAVRHGYLIGFREPFMAELVDSLIKTVGNHYKFLEEKKSFIKEQIRLEENRFFKTIEKGMTLFNEELKNSKDKFNGEVAFKLYDTFGFPLDLTQDMLREVNREVDIELFDKCMSKQKAKAKEAWRGSGDSAKEGDFKKILESIGKNEFIGYTQTTSKSKILALLDENFKLVDKLETNSIGWIMLDKTPFYATSGGQMGDIGELNSGKIIVTQTEKFFDLNLSKVEIKAGSLNINDEVNTIVINRKEVEKHHSATHLLQSALKNILGDTVSQAGSLNDDKRLRFDFTYPKAMSSNQIQEVEDLVNKFIDDAIYSNIQELSIDEAKKTGAIAMFGEKYGDRVRVVKFDDKSIEFCGGTHISNTSEIGSFYIIKESGVSAGVRRIEAVCGKSARNFAKDMRDELKSIKNELKTQNPLMAVDKLKEQIKTLKNELNNAYNSTKKELETNEINGVTTIVAEVENGDIKALIDEAKNRYPKIAIMLMMKKGDKVMIACGSKDTTIKAGDWIKEIAPILGGGGGGRPDFAQAGGKDISKIDEALAKSKEYLENNL